MWRGSRELSCPTEVATHSHARVGDCVNSLCIFVQRLACLTYLEPSKIHSELPFNALKYTTNLVTHSIMRLLCDYWSSLSEVMHVVYRSALRERSESINKCKADTPVCVTLGGAFGSSRSIAGRSRKPRSARKPTLWNPMPLTFILASGGTLHS